MQLSPNALSVKKANETKIRQKILIRNFLKSKSILKWYTSVGMLLEDKHTTPALMLS